MASATIERFGRLDYVVNCAGVLGPAMRSSDTPVSAFDRINDVNYRGSWLVSRAALGLMVAQAPLPEQLLQRGSIVNIASQLGLVGRVEAGESLELTVRTGVRGSNADRDEQPPTVRPRQLSLA